MIKSGLEPAEGRYTNFLRVGHNQSEFVLDFGQCFPEADEPRFHTRLIVSPTHVVMFADLIQQCIAQHEAEHGPARRCEGGSSFQA